MGDKSVSTINLINQMRAADDAPNALRSLPIATDENIAEIATGFLTYPEIKTYFWNTLVNRIAMTVIKNSRFTNPFNRLRKSDVALGQTIQEIFVKLCEEHEYHVDNPELMLATENPNIDAVYFVLNRRKYFKQTIYDTDLRWYFSSWEQLDSFVAKVIENMITSDEVNEFEYTKQALSMYGTKDLYYKVHIDPVTDDNTGTQAIQQLQAYSKYLGFPNSKFNARRNITTNTTDQLVLFVTVDFDSKLGAYTQSKAFNLDKVEYLANRIVVDNFGENNIQAVLTTEDFLNLRNYFIQAGAFYNQEILATNYWYHHHEYIYTSQLENAIAFTTDTVAEDTVTAITVSPTTVALPGGSSLQFMADVTATGNATKEVLWSISGNTSTDTLINDRTGQIYIGEDETAEITVTATSVFNNTVTGTATVTRPV